MNLVKAITCVLMLWSSTAWGATLTWNANSEPDLAGYHVYQCDQLPCTRSSANASLFSTLGKVTSVNIGTPSVTRYYFTTAYDFSNRESGGSTLAIFRPAGSPPPPPPTMGNVRLTVVGNPATGPWGVNAITSNPQDVMAQVRLDGAAHHTDDTAPYGFPGANGTTVRTELFGTGSHTVEFVFYLQGTTSEIGRTSITVMEGKPAPAAAATGSVKLTVVGDPATGPWGVNATTTNPQDADVMTHVRLDGVLQNVKNHAPYDFFPRLYGTGPHTVEFVSYLQGTTSEIGRTSITVMEGKPAPAAAATGPVKLTVVGDPATGPWGVNATTTNPQDVDVMAHVRLDGIVKNVENHAPYELWRTRYGTGAHTVEFVFYQQNTTSEIGRATLTVKEGG